MLETQALESVGEFDIDAEVVGIELELITLEQPGVLVDVERERRDLAIDGEFPVPIARRFGLKIDAHGTVRQLMFSHGVSSRYATFLDALVSKFISPADPR